jgi:hypothetical protein
MARGNEQTTKQTKPGTNNHGKESCKEGRQEGRTRQEGRRQEGCTC